MSQRAAWKSKPVASILPKVVSRGIWLTGASGLSDWFPLAGWITEPAAADAANDLGVVMLPPIGYEYSGSHRFLRTLAESIAAGGATVLRVDYPGTADSVGHVEELDSLEAWRCVVPAAVSYLRDRGIRRIALIGCQLGATFALQDGPALQPAGIVAIDPVMSGRRFLRALNLIGFSDPDGSGGVAHGGHYFGRPVLDEIKALTVSNLEDVPVLSIVDEPRVAAFMQRPAEEAEVDSSLIAEIADWIGALASPGERGWLAGGESNAEARFSWDGQEIRERFVTVGPDELVGVLTRPGSDDGGRGLLVLLNSGSDPHTGPGRAWVELARHMAIRGYSTLRVDLRGWGESPDGPRVPGRPFDAHAVDDVARLVSGLAAEGYEDIVLCGLCSGAWFAMQAARQVPVRGIVALNAPLYWQPGDPILALASAVRAYRLDEIASFKSAAAAGRWDAEDAAGIRPPSARLLDDLVHLGCNTTLVFAEGDDGLEYLHDRLARRMRAVTASGVIRVVEMPAGVDHSLHHTWLRPVAYSVIASEVGRLLGGSVSIDPSTSRSPVGDSEGRHRSGLLIEAD
jgi:esterase/lipase